MTPVQVEARFQRTEALALAIGSGLVRLEAGVLELNHRLASINARAIQAHQEYGSYQQSHGNG